MTAVATVDRIGAIVILTLVGVIFVADGIRNLLRVRAGSSPSSRPDTCQAPAPRPVPVEPGNFVAVGSSYREGEAVPLRRHQPTATAIEALTFPSVYTKAGNKR